MVFYIPYKLLLFILFLTYDGTNNQNNYGNKHNNNCKKYIGELIGISEKVHGIKAGIYHLTSVGFSILGIYLSAHPLKIGCNCVPLLNGHSVFIVNNVINKILRCERITLGISGSDGNKTH